MLLVLENSLRHLFSKVTGKKSLLSFLFERGAGEGGGEREGVVFALENSPFVGSGKQLSGFFFFQVPGVARVLENNSSNFLFHLQRSHLY